MANVQHEPYPSLVFKTSFHLTMSLTRKVITITMDGKWYYCSAHVTFGSTFLTIVHWLKMLTTIAICSCNRVRIRFESHYGRLGGNVDGVSGHAPSLPVRSWEIKWTDTTYRSLLTQHRVWGLGKLWLSRKPKPAVIDREGDSMMNKHLISSCSWQIKWTDTTYCSLPMQHRVWGLGNLWLSRKPKSSVIDREGDSIINKHLISSCSWQIKWTDTTYRSLPLQHRVWGLGKLWLSRKLKPVSLNWEGDSMINKHLISVDESLRARNEPLHPLITSSDHFLHVWAAYNKWKMMKECIKCSCMCMIGLHAVPSSTTLSAVMAQLVRASVSWSDVHGFESRSWQRPSTIVSGVDTR